MRHGLVVSVVWALAACGPKTSEGEDDNGDSTGGDATGGDASTSATSTATSSSTTGVDGDSGPGDSTGAPQCDEYLGEDGTAITLNVRNARATPVFLDLNGCGPVFSLTGPDSDAATPWRFPDCDMPSCDSLVSGDCSVSCAGGGGACQPEIIRLEAGAVYSQGWSGSVYVDATPPAACASLECEPACHQRVPATAGAYAIAAGVYDACPLADVAMCECEPIDGTCTVVAENITVMPTEAMASFDYPGETAPEIVVE